MGWQTLQEEVVFADEPVKGSRFVGLAAPVQDEVGALAVVEDARGRWPDASHHCWAYALHDGRHRTYDDGEPGGSAGRPIHAQIEGHAVTDVVVVVARWFGGTKLGVGGLIRAYGGCGGRTLDRGAFVEVIQTVRVRIKHAYEDTGAVQAVLASRGVQVVDTVWDARITMDVVVALPEAGALLDALRDRTSGRAELSTRE
jgi:putative IMPACT (imprinted ancient) family translation regulator